MNIASPFNLQLDDGHSKGKWLFQLTGTPSVSWLTQDQFSIVLNKESRKIGDFDEQRTWKGGRGGERFSDDPDKYMDGKDVFTAIDGHLFPSLQWNISEGYRAAVQGLPGSIAWRGLIGDWRYASCQVYPSTAITADKAYVWVRRVGTPGILTLELCSDNSGKPGTVLKTVTVAPADFTDVTSQLKEFDWTGTQALSASTTYHIKMYGTSADGANNHWEVGTEGIGGPAIAYTSTDNSTWIETNYVLRYRITDADIVRRWWYFMQGANFCKVSNEATASLYKWNEASNVWEIVAAATHGLGQVTGRPIEVNGFVYFPQGDAVAIRTWDGTNWDAQTVATGQGCATGLAVGFSSSDNSTQIWRYNNALVSGGTTTGLAVSVSRADAVAAYNTDLAFRNSIKIGETGNVITNIISVNNVLWVYKVNSVGTVDNDRYTELDYGVKKTPSATNGIAAISWNGFTFYNWLFSTMRIYSGTVDDIGQGFKNNSFPYGREGVDAAYTTYVSWLFVAKDAGDGTSSVMLYDGVSWHEMARAWKEGKRIRDVAIQTVSGERNRLWFDCGGDSCYIELPYQKGNPLADAGAKYMHESVIESCIIDMGAASKLPKFIKEMTLTCKNLNGQGIRVEMDYQVDDNIGTTNWTEAGVFLFSPEDTVAVNESNIRRFKYRLRLYTENQLIPPDISGIVPNGYARSPMRKTFQIEAKINNVTVNGKKQLARDVINWLEEASESAYPITMHSKFEQLNDYYNVIIAPPNIHPVKAVPESDVITFSALVL